MTSSNFTKNGKRNLSEIPKDLRHCSFCDYYCVSAELEMFCAFTCKKLRSRSYCSHIKISNLNIKNLNTMKELCMLPDGTDFYYNGVRFTKICQSSQVDIKVYNTERAIYDYFGRYVQVKPVR